jgi:CRP/FNR family transcriptional regulator, cyclic AMP receptor protein
VKLERELKANEARRFKPKKERNDMATATMAMGRTMGQGFRYVSDAQVKANSPYGLPVIEDVRDFNLGESSFFSGLAEETLEELNYIKHTSSYPEGAVVLMEGQAARGVYIVCQGRVKLMTTNADGKTLIVKIAQPGEVLGLQSVVTGDPYELTVETLQPSQLAFIARDQFLKFLRKHADACLRATQHLSSDCHSAYEVIRSIGLCHSVAGKLARLLKQWSSETRTSNGVVRMKMALTHEELAQLIGSSRETVTRILGDFRRRGVVELNGATLTIKNHAALEALCVA